MVVLAVLILLGALFFAGKVAIKTHEVAEKRRLRQEGIEKWSRAIERDPSNSGALGQLAEILIEDGDLEQGIHYYRTAIGLSPRGPFVTRWKRHLKQALELQEAVERARAAGEKIPTYADWRVCHECDATVLVRDKVCHQCHAQLNMGFWEWALSKETLIGIWRATWPATLIVWVCILLFLQLPVEVKGVVICASLLVGFYYFRKSFDGERG